MKKGQKMPENLKQNLSNKLKGRAAWNKGKIAPWANTEGLKKGHGWNRGTKGIMKSNKTSFKKGIHVSPETEFKKGEMSEKMKGNHNSPLGEKNPNWKGGNSRYFLLKTATRPKPDSCEVCGSFSKDFKKGLHFDHDHKTGKFRGWLCGRCNVALGMVRDSKDLLRELISYLESHET